MRVGGRGVGEGGFMIKFSTNLITFTRHISTIGKMLDPSQTERHTGWCSSQAEVTLEPLSRIKPPQTTELMRAREWEGEDEEVGGGILPVCAVSFNIAHAQSGCV